MKKETRKKIEKAFYNYEENKNLAVNEILEDIASFSMLDSKNIEKGDPFIVFKESAAMTVKLYMEGVAKNNTKAKWDSASW